ncbi:MAG: hypothetical protein NC328_01160 [Muribaculum sp.]|nr:hypothetical protein [Muribaculum sp.]
MTNRRLEDVVTDWIRREAVPALDVPAGCPVRLTKVAAVPGEPDFANQALSMTLHVGFESLGMLRHWMKSRVEPVTDDFHARFSDESLHFISILKEISLD